MQKIVLQALIFFVCIVRFVWLETAPPGFYVDESGRAMAAICLRERGTDAIGNGYPLYGDMGFGDRISPSMFYLSAIWSQIFGDSIQSYRAIAASIVSITLLFLYYAAKAILPGNYPFYVLLLGVISPWGFQFSRIYWDGPLAAMFVTAGAAFLLHSKKSVVYLCLAAGAFGCAYYSYPPAWVYATLSLPVLMVLRGNFKLKEIAIFGAAFCLILVPFSIKLFSGELLARASMLSIWSPGYLASVGMTQEPLGIAKIFLQNMSKHLNLGFLLMKGDANLRHSTGVVGILSWPEFLGIVTAIGAFLQQRGWRRNILLIGILAVFTFVPAALTWESLPHALRSIVGWPFWPMLGGVGLVWLDSIDRRQIHKTIIALLTVIFSLYYLHDYFFRYPIRASAWFDADIKNGFENYQGSYHKEALGYYYYTQKSELFCGSAPKYPLAAKSDTLTAN